MRLLIDGYNLLHVTDLFGRGASFGTLHGSREALLEFLALALTASQRRATTIVFDAAGAPPGLPATLHYDHITARFARNYPDADTLLEEIIEAHKAPRGLLVVSSDHRVSRAGRRRGAKTVDSQTWFHEQQRVVRDRQQSGGHLSKGGRDGGGAVVDWIRVFATPEMAELERQIRATPAPSPPSRQSTREKRSRTTEAPANLDNPFPPGYADDLLADE